MSEEIKSKAEQDDYHMSTAIWEPYLDMIKANLDSLENRRRDFVNAAIDFRNHKWTDQDLEDAGKYFKWAHYIFDESATWAKGLADACEGHEEWRTSRTLTDYDSICIICGKPAQCRHHLVFGNALRSKADKDNLIMAMCNDCHNMATQVTGRIHDNSMAESLSKIVGQLVYELRYMDPEARKKAREDFRKRYGRSYL